MFCTKCGLNIINDTANFCKRCGHKLRNRTSNSSIKTTNSTADFVQKAREKMLNFASPKIEKTKQFTTEKIDSLQNNLQNQSKYKKLSVDQRTFLAQKLSSLRSKIADEEQESMSITEAQEIVDISEELLEQIKDDKCLICYKGLRSSTEEKTQLVLCPHCGHGGHKNHIFSWFESKESCPYCKVDVGINQVLILLA